MVDFAQERPERRAVVRDSAYRDTAEIDSVVGAFAADEPDPLGLAASDMIGAGNLQRGFGSFAPRIDEEDVAESRGQHRPQSLGGAEGERVADLERRGIIELADRRTDSVDDL